MTRDGDEDTEDEIDDGLEADGIALPISSEAADPLALVQRKIPSAILSKYEVHSYRNAAIILSEAWPIHFGEIVDALLDFKIDVHTIRTAGGNESEIPKKFATSLRPKGWHETTIRADLDVTVSWKDPSRKRSHRGRQEIPPPQKLIKRERFVDGHKIDFVKDKVAFDLEWNSKDQTFDRDLYAMNAFFLSGALDVGVLVTRSRSLDDVFKSVGPALTKDGTIERYKDGREKPTMAKYGASTTWMGKLLYRLNAGRNGGCPILAIGITPSAVVDWNPN